MTNHEPLESRVAGTALPSQEEFTKRFADRYRSEQSFREIVHRYLRLSRMKEGALAVAKTLHLPWYKSETGRLVNKYAATIYTETARLTEVERGLEELRRAEQIFQAAASALNAQQAAAQEKAEELNRTAEEAAAARAQIQKAYQEKVLKEERTAEQVSEEILKSTDAQAVVKEKLGQMVMGSPLVKVDDEGTLRFDEEQMVRRLEEMALDEIIEGIEGDSTSGFISRLGRTYDEVITHLDEIQDLSELAQVDWLQSAVYSRMKGHEYPTFPHLIVGRGDGKGRTSIDTAVTIDRSGSMDKRNRMNMAVKTGLAMTALMRRLNAGSHTYLSVFSDDIRQVTSRELRNTYSEGSTRTELAIDWLGKTLAESGLCIAYIITDGAPNHMEETIAAARRLQNNPNILLRIFLIDGTEGTEENIRKIGMAAGQYTKVIPVESYALGKRVIGDVSDAIGEIRVITEF